MEPCLVCGVRHRFREYAHRCYCKAENEYGYWMLGPESNRSDPRFSVVKDRKDRMKIYWESLPANEKKPIKVT